MRINIKDPFSGLSGFSHLPLDIDKEWLKKRMKDTGQSATKCVCDELDKIPGMLKENVRHASEVNRAYAKFYNNNDEREE